METELKQAEEIKQENIELKKQLHALVEESSRQTEELKRELRESERQRLNLEQENKDLRTQLAEYVQKYRAAQIELANRCATNSPLPQDSQETVIPKNAEATVANAGAKRAAMVPLNSVKILKQVKIQQSDQFIQPGQPLRALRPFTVFTTMRLPKAPSASFLANELADFAVTVEAREATAAEREEVSSVVDELICGKQDYDVSVFMPSLAAGRYSLKISALVPYARIDEQEKLEIAVVN
jgi:DNA repair exonuclease SbcCD ATPase subunit